MNQILSTENINKKKKRKINGNGKINSDIEKIVMFFAVSLIIFGAFMTGTGTYAMYKDKEIKDNTPVKPQISVEEISDNELKMQVTSQKDAIDQISYYWNSEESKNITGNQRKAIEETILIPGGKNTLHIQATNISGQQSTFEQEYYRESDITIQVSAADNSNIKIYVEGKSEISYITYKWDDGEETKIEVNDTKTNQEIETLKGKHTLTIVAADINNNTETKQQEVNGVTKPEVTVTTDGDYFIIHAKDEEELTLLEVTINEDPNKKYKLDLTDEKVKQTLMTDSKSLEYKFPYPLETGENKIVVTVYNSNNVSATFKAKLTK